MYGAAPPKPSFFRAFSAALVFSAPLAWLAWDVLHWHSWQVIALWIGLACAGAFTILGRMDNDWRAKDTMRVMQDRYRR
jgi:hypothetical protein